MPSQSYRNHQYAPHFALLAVQLFFGTAPVLGRFALLTFSPYSIVGFRVGGAAVAFYFLQRFRGNLQLDKAIDYLYFIAFAIIGIALNQLLFFKGLSLTTAVNTSLIAVTIPIFTILIGSLLGSDSLSWIKVFGIAIAAIGVTILINPANASFSSETTLGDFCILLNSLAWAFYVAVSKRFLIKYGVLKSIAWLFLFASIFNVPIGIYFMQDIVLSEVSYASWLAVAGIVLFPTILAYYTNAWALSRVEPSTVSVYVYLQPLIGFASAVLFLGEKLSFRPVISTILIFSGVYLVTRKSKITPNET